MERFLNVALSHKNPSCVVKNAVAEGDFICRGISERAPVERFLNIMRDKPGKRPGELARTDICRATDIEPTGEMPAKADRIGRFFTLSD